MMMMTTAITLTTQLTRFKKTANKKQKGFTLIELAIIIAIIDITTYIIAVSIDVIAIIDVIIVCIAMIIVYCYYYC